MLYIFILLYYARHLSSPGCSSKFLPAQAKFSALKLKRKNTQT